MIIYKSKIGAVLVIPLVALTVGTAVMMLSERDWWSFGGLLLTGAFVTHMMLSTYYRLDGSHLQIRCGFLYFKELDVYSVKKIVETSNPLSAPAASLDRLEIFYGHFKSVMISPRDKKGFIREMLRIHPGIEVKLKNKTFQVPV